MKRLSRKQKNRQRRLTAHRTLRHQCRAAKGRRWLKSGYAYDAKKCRKRERIKVRAPDVIDFYNPRYREATAKFLELLRTVTLLRGHRVRIDFSETKRVTAAATLALLAEIDRIRRYLEKEGFVRCVPPTDAVVSQVFQQIGLAKLIGIDRQVKINHDHVRFWQFITDTTSGGDATGHILERFKDQLTKEVTTELLAAVTEALTNTVHHSALAQRPDRVPVLPKRWWMFARVHKNQLTMVVCDLGIGIPASVPLNWRDVPIGRLLANLGFGSTDGAIIRLAMEITRTVTKTT